MTNPREDTVQSVASHRREPRRDSLRTLVVLVVAAGALLAFIAALGDFRRQQNALGQMQWHAGTYSMRMSDAGQLPLNLEPDVAPERQTKMIKVHWISRNDARTLREGAGRVIVAHSAPIPRALATNGRAIVIFEGGSFRVEWSDLEAFDQAMQAQQRQIDRLEQQRSNTP